MKNQFFIELKMNYKKIIIPTLIMAGLVFGSMFFFPTVADNMGVLEDFLQVGLMRNVLSVFGINAASFGSLLGFYSAYASMWIMLIGAIFFSYFSAEMTAKEEKRGTIEYLLARPTSRSEIYAAKYFTLIILIIGYMIVIGIIGYGSLELQKSAAPYQLDMTKHSPAFEKNVLDNSATISSWLDPVESDFNQFTYSMLLSEYQANEQEIKDSGIQQQDIDEILQNLQESPEGFFEQMKQNPRKYMDMFNIQELSEEEFIKELNDSEQMFKELKIDFLSSNNQVKDYYSMSPSYFLSKIKNKNKVVELNTLLNGAAIETGIFSKYDITKYLTLTMNMFLIIIVLASLSFAFSALMKGDFSAAQVAMITILIMYFINSFAGISAKTEFLKRLTPFGYINTNVADPNYGFELSNVMILISICLLAYIVGLIRYRKKNFS